MRRFSGRGMRLQSEKNSISYYIIGDGLCKLERKDIDSLEAGGNMNNRKIVLYIATSLDGYIATTEHTLDWLFAIEGEGDNGFSKFYDTINTILIGRTTYDWIMKQENGNFPYKDRECYVFSRRQHENTKHVTFIQGDIVEFVKDLKNKADKNIWIVGGGDLLQTFIRESLIDEIIISIAPVLLGRGIELFKENNFQSKLLLKSTCRYNQFVELHYFVKH